MDLSFLLFSHELELAVPQTRQNLFELHNLVCSQILHIAEVLTQRITHPMVYDSLTSPLRTSFTQQPLRNSQIYSSIFKTRLLSSEINTEIIFLPKISGSTLVDPCLGYQESWFLIG